MTEKQTEVVAKLVLSALVCGLGGLCMYLTVGQTGIGWSVLAVAFIWCH